MGFFNKDEQENAPEEDYENQEGTLPDLPALPELPQEPMSKKRDKKSPLPSMPNSPAANEFNQANIKDAVSEQEPIEPLSRPAPNPLPPMMTSPPIHQPRHQRTMEMSNWDQPQESHEEHVTQPLFIKLDTFEKAIASFNDIKLRIGEIESLLRNIREIKNKEEAELTEWEQEMDEIKARLEQVNQEIFEKIE